MIGDQNIFSYAIDNDYGKYGDIWHGLKIFRQGYLNEIDMENVYIVINSSYQVEICKQPCFRL